MEQILKIILLGIVQGITEWLPISSTGHLKIFEHYLGLKTPILFDITLHIGTLIVVLIFFRKEVIEILKALAKLDFKTEYGQLIPLIIVGTIPTAVIGLIFGDLIEKSFQVIPPIAVAFTICGLILYPTKIMKEKKDEITYLDVILIGIAQGISIIPGISRSGITIATALLLGLKRDKAFKFSFLLSIPAIIGAFSLEFYKEHSQLTASGLSWTGILVGTVITMVVGYLTLKLLWKIITKRKFYLFAYYCWITAIILATLTICGF
ncbi:undecaprenyl-diphosphate phosphatase [Candidatus Bathyarchaeota archaeon]|nr:MAG: undecaprenyl-diphosphate phosphatase [Candidatus Bathyarchaeota archaeon]